MNKQTTIIIVIVALIALAGGFMVFRNSASSKATQEVDKHEDGTAHTEGDSHVQDESKPHTDVTPHASPTSESTDSGRKPAAVDDHVDAKQHAEDEPHN